MIRRGFWLVVGATVGITGYRRASRLVQSIVPAGRAAAPETAAVARRRVVTGRSVLAGAARAGRGAAQGAAFVRDVRDGMAEYVDRQAQAGRTLESRSYETERERRAPGIQRP